MGVARAAASTVPGGPSGMVAASSDRHGSGIAADRRDSIIPKATALTLILSGPHSFASDFVRPITPAFAVA